MRPGGKHNVFVAALTPTCCQRWRRTDEQRVVLAFQADAFASRQQPDPSAAAKGTLGNMNPCLSQGCDEQVFESPLGHRITPRARTCGSGQSAATYRTPRAYAAICIH